MARTKVAQERGEPRPGRKAASELGFDAYRRLREAIIAGRFVPNERLGEANLSKALGPGRTAVRAPRRRRDPAGAAMRDHLEEVLETLRWAIGHKSRPPQWLPD